MSVLRGSGLALIVPLVGCASAEWDDATTEQENVGNVSLELTIPSAACGAATADDSDAWSVSDIYSSHSPNASYDHSAESCPDNYIYDVTGTSGKDYYPYVEDAWTGSIPTNQTDCEESGWSIRLYECSGGTCSSVALRTWGGSWSGSACSWVGAIISAVTNTSATTLRMVGNAWDPDGKVPVLLKIGVRDD